MATPAQRKKMLTIKAPARPTVTVNLLGKPYEVTRPKSMLSLQLASMPEDVDPKNKEEVAEVRDSMDALVTSLFGAKADEVRARLADPADDLDLGHIGDTARAVSEHFAKETPTT